MKGSGNTKKTSKSWLIYNRRLYITRKSMRTYWMTRMPPLESLRKRSENLLGNYEKTQTLMTGRSFTILRYTRGLMVSGSLRKATNRLQRMIGAAYFPCFANVFHVFSSLSPMGKGWLKTSFVSACYCVLISAKAKWCCSWGRGISSQLQTPSRKQTRNFLV